MPESTDNSGFFDSSGYGPRDDLAKYGVTKRKLSMAEVAYYAGIVFPGDREMAKAGIPLGNVATMTAIAWAESGGDTQAHNPVPPDDSYGLWQINMIGGLGSRRRAQFGLKDNKELYNPVTNALAAKAVYQEQGFKAWSVYTNGKYKTYLEQAREAVKNPVTPNTVVEGAPTDTIVGGVLLDNFVNPVLDFFKAGALRIAGFAAGAVLVILAVRMYMK